MYVYIYEKSVIFILCYIMLYIYIYTNLYDYKYKHLHTCKYFLNIYCMCVSLYTQNKYTQ